MCENKPNTNPIRTQFKPNTNPIPEKPKMKLNSYSTKDYENETAFKPQKNKPNSNPISKGTFTQSGQVGLNKLFRRVFCVPISLEVFVVQEDY